MVYTGNDRAWASDAVLISTTFVNAILQRINVLLLLLLLLYYYYYYIIYYCYVGMRGDGLKGTRPLGIT